MVQVEERYMVGVGAARTWAFFPPDDSVVAPYFKPARSQVTWEGMGPLPHQSHLSYEYHPSNLFNLLKETRCLQR